MTTATTAGPPARRGAVLQRRRELRGGDLAPDRRRRAGRRGSARRRARARPSAFQWSDVLLAYERECLALAGAREARSCRRRCQPATPRWADLAPRGARRGAGAALGAAPRRPPRRRRWAEARRQRVSLVSADARISGAAPGLRLAAVPAGAARSRRARDLARLREAGLRLPAPAGRSRPVPRAPRAAAAARCSTQLDAARSLFA